MSIHYPAAERHLSAFQGLSGERFDACLVTNQGTLQNLGYEDFCRQVSGHSILVDTLSRTGCYKKLAALHLLQWHSSCLSTS